MESKGKLLIFSAPSGAGKTTLVHHIMHSIKKLSFSISATSRPKRGNEVDGKEYYGCCMGCKAKLKNDPNIRFAIDPVSGNSVDKAIAVIGAAPNSDVYYFENLENLQRFILI